MPDRSKLIKPGADDQAPGKYVEVDPNGEVIREPRTVEIQAGDRLPPTSASGNRWMKK